MRPFPLAVRLVLRVLVSLPNAGRLLPRVGNPPARPERLVLVAVGCVSALIPACLPLPAAAAEPALSLVHTVPVETGLDRVGADPAATWVELVDGAERSVDWAAFYISPRPEGDGRLEGVLDALDRAAARGVRVRILADAGFHDTYPEVLDAFGARPGTGVRLIDFRSVAGGPMHAKYFVVDGRTAVVGSQNSDWRALEHIVEMGLVFRLPAYARELGRVFEMDWERADPLGPDARTGEDTPSRYGDGPILTGPLTWETAPGDTAALWPAFSPTGFLPQHTQWDLRHLLNLMRSATATLHVTCLTYNPQSRDGSYWEVLDDELRKAAVRGVEVRLLVSDWNKRPPKIDYLKSLQHVPGVEVRMVTIPEAKEGFIPFARVIHAKYMTVDGGAFWLGTSNWEKSYFFSSRNVGAVVRYPALTADLDRAFLDLWNSPYAYPVDPCVEYEPPRIGP